MINRIQQLREQLESAEIVRVGLEKAALQHDAVATYLDEARDAEAACRAELQVTLREAAA